MLSIRALHRARSRDPFALALVAMLGAGCAGTRHGADGLPQSGWATAALTSSERVDCHREAPIHDARITRRTSQSDGSVSLWLDLQLANGANTPRWITVPSEIRSQSSDAHDARKDAKRTFGHARTFRGQGHVTVVEIDTSPKRYAFFLPARSRIRVRGLLVHARWDAEPRTAHFESTLARSLVVSGHRIEALLDFDPTADADADVSLGRDPSSEVALAPPSSDDGARRAPGDDGRRFADCTAVKAAILPKSDQWQPPTE